MSTADSTLSLPLDVTRQEVRQRLFAEPDLQVYAVLDGASVPGLLEHFAQDAPEHVCLYRGDLGSDLAECAPYLVRLPPEAPFTHWVIKEGWGNHWGIFAVSSASITTLRKHFRTFLVVKDPNGKQLYFRYYDPRVLRAYLPTCNAQETASVFGPLSGYFCEGDAPNILLSFRRVQDQLRKEFFALS